MELDLSKTQSYLNWLSTKLFLDSQANKAAKRKVKRGQVYWFNIGINIGNEMSKSTPRPCVIIQNDIANVSSPNTIICPITHDSSKLPCIVPIKKVYNGKGEIILDGNVNVSNIMCISKARLGDIIINTELDEINDIECALAKQLGIYGYYDKIKKQLDKQTNHFKNVEKERNRLQDFTIKLKNKLNVLSDKDTLEKIQKLLDKQ